MMRKTALILLFATLTFYSLPQDNPNNIFDRTLTPDINTQLDTIQRELGEKKIVKAISYWKLAYQGTEKKVIQIDTSIQYAHISHPAYISNISNSHTGNLGAPTQSNIFIKRKEVLDFFFFSPYLDYLKLVENHRFIHTNVPLTKLKYVHGGSRKNAENNLSVLYSRNINPFWNTGFSYNSISSKGFYPNQKSKIYNLSFFSSYEKPRYKAYLLMTKNMLLNEENGGVQADSLITDTILDAENLLVHFNDMKTKIAYFSLFSSLHYTFSSANDSLKKAPFKLVYTFHYEKTRRKHYENTVDTAYFPQTFVNKNSYLELIDFNKLQNSLHLILRKKRFGLDFGLRQQHKRYEHPDYFETDTTTISSTIKAKKVSNTILQARFYSLKSPNLSWNVNGKSFVAGNRKGSWDVKGKLSWKAPKKKSSISLLANIYVGKPNYLLNFWEGNHQQWSRKLENEKKISLALDYKHMKPKLNIGVRFDRVKNLVYFDTLANIAQAPDEINITTIFAESEFKLWKFHFSQKIYYQHSNNRRIVPLPQLSLYSNNYFKSYVFNRAALVHLGVDVHYHTAFYAPAYMPPIGRYYLQNEKKLGEYPYINIYLNTKIKNTTLFIMYAHANERYGSRTYFQSLHYPHNPAHLKWGVKWNFYD